MSEIQIFEGVKLKPSSYFQKIKKYKIKFEHIPEINKMLSKVLEVDESLQAGKLPPQLPFLEVNNIMIDKVKYWIINKYPNQPIIGNEIWKQKINQLMNLDRLLRCLRDELINRYKMYGYVSSESILAMSQYLNGRKTLELMAGYGYLSAGLKKICPTQFIHAVDNESWKFQPQQSQIHFDFIIEKIDALEALIQYGNMYEVILLSWAPDKDEIDLKLLSWIRNYFKGEFLLIGEYKGATNSQSFWENAYLEPIYKYNNKVRSFDIINEQLYRVK